MADLLSSLLGINPLGASSSGGLEAGGGSGFLDNLLGGSGLNTSVLGGLNGLGQDSFSDTGKLFNSSVLTGGLSDGLNGGTGLLGNSLPGNDVLGGDLLSGGLFKSLFGDIGLGLGEPNQNSPDSGIGGLLGGLFNNSLIQTLFRGLLG